MSDATGKKAVLSLDGKQIDLPIYSGTLGPDVIDVKDVLAQGHFTFDPGFMATAACESKITFIDGDKGVLLHRGYPIDQLAEKALNLTHSNGQKWHESGFTPPQASS